MKLENLGEFEFIERMRKRLPRRTTSILGIGDDCAVINYKKDVHLLVTQDMLIEDVHFDIQNTTFYKMGRK
ncbi:MAG: thiamine-phosphate kinase, partial [Candidatus Omnitrophica bacterium]|nr:thiamine-phosphate kinase [Candidatus Omnitrophota bacterium]